MRWTNKDMLVEMGLENIELLPGVVPAAVVPKRLFKAWMEDWEFDCLHDKDPVSKEKLLHKYGGLMWHDEDNENELFVANSLDMDYGLPGGTRWVRMVCHWKACEQ